MTDKRIGGKQGQEILTIARTTLTTEANELIGAGEKLGEAFLRAVSVIAACEGKVVCSGLGKSGHIARKIAATMSSTGTPAFFLHPGEALHGDLGVIGKQDCLLVIAFGGETRETIEVARFGKNQNLKVICLTGRLDSGLAKLADIVIDGSVTKEACPLNLAPTSSTTLALALGDALAVSLMHARGFSERDFASFHPSGSLGRRLSKVTDHCRRNLAVLRKEASFEEIIEVMTKENYGVAAVLDQSESLCGVISDGDLRRALITQKSQIFSRQAADLMSQAPKTIKDDQLAIDAITIMESNQISSLFVVDAKTKLVGLIRMYDLLEAKII